MSIFSAANILIPNLKNMEKWAVIACDQFTSQPEYWNDVKEYVAEEFSTLNMIFPEAYLKSCCKENKIQTIKRNMRDYYNKGIFEEYTDSMIYVERRLSNGLIRKGVVGKVDLESYDYNPLSDSVIRATEKTVVERIPPRVEIRKDALLEFPHILLLCDDKEKILIEFLSNIKDKMKLIYDFDLMQEGGHISGWLVEGDKLRHFNELLGKYICKIEDQYSKYNVPPIFFAVGDGNHSLATAKACYESDKNELTRYALVELCNLHDESISFEPIHRVITNIDSENFLQCLKDNIVGDNGESIKLYVDGKEQEVYIIVPKDKILLDVVQNFLDNFIHNNGGEIDYIHGEKDLIELTKDKNSAGIILPSISKDDLFEIIAKKGSLPRKTFSIGEARDKRYYLEGRKIK